MEDQDLADLIRHDTAAWTGPSGSAETARYRRRSHARPRRYGLAAAGLVVVVLAVVVVGASGTRALDGLPVVLHLEATTEATPSAALPATAMPTPTSTPSPPEQIQAPAPAPREGPVVVQPSRPQPAPSEATPRPVSTPSPARSPDSTPTPAEH